MATKRKKKDPEFQPIRMTEDELNKYNALQGKLTILKLREANLRLTAEKTTRVYQDTMGKLTRDIAETGNSFLNEKVPYDAFIVSIAEKYNVSTKLLAIDDESGVITQLEDGDKDKK